MEAAFAEALGAMGAGRVVVVVLDALDALCGADAEGAAPAARLVGRFGRAVMAASGGTPPLLLLASCGGTSAACLHEGVRGLWQHAVSERDFMVRAAASRGVRSARRPGARARDSTTSGER